MNDKFDPDNNIEKSEVYDNIMKENYFSHKSVKKNRIVFLSFIIIIMLCTLFAVFLLPKIQEKKIKISLEKQFSINIDHVEFERVGWCGQSKDISYDIGNKADEKKISYCFHAYAYSDDCELYTIDGYTNFFMNVIYTNYEVEIYLEDIYKEIKDVIDMEFPDTNFFILISQNATPLYERTSSYEDFKDKKRRFTPLYTHLVFSNTFTEKEFIKLEIEFIKKRWPYCISFEVTDEKYVNAISEIGYISIRQNYKKLQDLFDQEHGNPIFSEYDQYIDFEMNEIQDIKTFYPSLYSNNEYLYTCDSHGDLNSFVPAELVLNYGTDKEHILAIRKDMSGMIKDTQGNRFIVLSSKDVLKLNSIESDAFISFVVNGKEMIRQEVTEDTIWDEQTIFIHDTSIIEDSIYLDFGCMREECY